MKSRALIIYTLLYALGMGVTMLFPYIIYNDYQYEYTFSLIAERKLIVSNAVLSGYEILPVYGLLVGVVFVFPFIMVRQTNMLSGIARGIGVLLTIYICILSMALTSEPSYYKDYNDVRLQNGFYAAIVITIIYTILLALNAAVVKRFPEDTKTPNPDLLDDKF